MAKRTKANPNKLFEDENPFALRQPRTDPLILARLLKAAGDDGQLEEDAKAVHPIILKWVDLESSGELAKTHETQLQGPFCEDILGKVLGYHPVNDANDDGIYHLEQEFHIDNTGSADAALGHFRPGQDKIPAAVVELKGAGIHLDRARSQGRNAVAQCWDYLYALPAQCRWGIVSNFVSFRLYDRTATPAKYEHFTLQSLRKFETFAQFYAVFHRKGLIETTAGLPPRILDLIAKTNDRQREVGDKLYDYYSQQRTKLIAHLMSEHGQELNDAIEMAQRLFDRVIFIAFCEDRRLLPEKSLNRAYKELPGFSAVTNPRWQNFKSLFQFINVGNDAHGIPGYNGGLFAKHPVDDLELDDEPWTNFFNVLGTYDFADEVNLDVLGHLFERSITEIEKLKETGLFGGNTEKANQYAEMPQSAKRKQLGTYYTPAVLTERIVRYTVDELIDERFAKLADELNDPNHVSAKFWQGCFDILRNLKVVDPACGSAAFLFQAYQCLSLRYGEVIDQLVGLSIEGSEDLAAQVPRFILNDNLYGVDLSPEAVEISQLALWIQSADRTQTLATLSQNIVLGNSLVHEPEVAEHGFDWKQRFPEVFESHPATRSVAAENLNETDNNSRDATHRRPRQPGFDCVIGNPPWERIKLQEREFFSLPAPEIATASNAAKRRKLVAKLESDDPALYERYQEALQAAQDLLDYCRKSKQYPLAGKGDINTYAVFAEVAENDRLIRLYDFENKKVFFPEVHASFKFSILNVGGVNTQAEEADFIFFAHSVDEIEDIKRHVKLTGDDIKLLNPNTRTCPIFRTRRDTEITKAIYRRVPVLIDKSRKKTGNPWGIKFKTMFHQTNDAELFREAQTLQQEGFRLDGNRWVKGKKVFLPLYVGMMFQAFDHRAAGVVAKGDNWFRQSQTSETTLVEHQNPEFLTIPKWWIQSDAPGIDELPAAMIGFKNVTSPTNRRTMIASFLPKTGVGNSAPLILLENDFSEHVYCCLLANLNSYALDYIARGKIGNVNLNFFLIEQFPMFTPDRYDEPCPWDSKQTLEQWISERVLKLTCTAEDMLPLAEACGFTAGSFKEYGGKLNKWNERERAQLMAELDAAYFILYGLDRADSQYILSTFKGIHDANPLFGGASTANHILDTYDELSARSMGA
ncbi:MAG: DNA methyltransferase [Planctomycetota bacterium]